MTVAFAVIFMAPIEKQLQTSQKPTESISWFLLRNSYKLARSPQKPFLWKRYIDDIFYARTIPETEINNFIDFGYSFRATFRFMNEQSKKIVFLDTEVFNGPRFIDSKIVDV